MSTNPVDSDKDIRKDRASRYYLEHRIRGNIFAALAVLVVIGVGTSGYMILEDWSFRDSFFMTITTLTTVGFTIVHPLSPLGEYFTIGLIVAGVGVAFYCFTSITQSIIEGELRTIRSLRLMQKSIDAMKGHVIICGYGRLARTVIARLQAGRQALVVIENRADELVNLTAAGIPHVEGSAYNDDILLRAGVKRASVLLAILPKDADNVYVTLCARDLNPNIRILARSEDESAEDKLRRAGASSVISPYGVSGARIAQQVVRPHVSDFLALAEGKDGKQLALEEIVVPENSRIGGKTLEESQLRSKTGAIIAAFVGRNGKTTMNPGGQSVIEPGSTMIVIGDQTALGKLGALLEQ